jgi:predicted unusual protein kinase regulating ubiquinone biosynthesis (AarF/ABC1/UbiB family)
VNLLPPKLSRYAAIATLLLKYGRVRPKPAGALGSPGETIAEEGEQDDAERLAADLEKLGPTFVKLGQLLSTRPELLPKSYRDALARLQDDVQPFPFAEAKRIVEEELGTRISKAFSRFDETPLAAASLGQVHRAALRDGRAVAVKIQRPGIVEQVRDDLEVLREVAQVLDSHGETADKYNITGIVDEFQTALAAELDYRREADNLRLLGGNLSEFRSIVVPKPVDGYTTAHVLTMDYVEGVKITALSPLMRIDIDAQELAGTLVHAYLKQIVLDGVFHADPHPGNVLLTTDGRLALIDLGMTGRVGPEMQERLLKLLLAISARRGEEVAEVLAAIGEKREGYNEAGFRSDVASLVNRHGHEKLGGLRVGGLIMELQLIGATHHLRGPAEMTMLGKTLLNLDEVARGLDPQLDVNATIAEDAAQLMTRRLAKSASAGMVSAMLEAKDFAERLPSRLNRVLDSLASSDLKLKVEMIDEGAVLEGLQKVANRITLGLIIAALIVGAAMMMRIDTSFRVLGYPGIAMILFLIAAAAGLWLGYDIVGADRAHGRRS